MTEAAAAKPVWRGGHLRELRWRAALARRPADLVWGGSGLPRGIRAPGLLSPGDVEVPGSRIGRASHGQAYREIAHALAPAP